VLQDVGRGIVEQWLQGWQVFTTTQDILERLLRLQGKSIILVDDNFPSCNLIIAGRILRR